MLPLKTNFFVSFTMVRLQFNGNFTTDVVIHKYWLYDVLTPEMLQNCNFR